MEEIEFNGDLILLRGLPGSGKSTLGNVILTSISTDTPSVISADDYFNNENGEYIFDATKLKEAHNQSLEKCADRMRLGIKKIVVANTFTTGWEMERYYEAANRYNYRVHSVIVENRHEGQNIHGVPDDKIKQMKNRFVIKL